MKENFVKYDDNDVVLVYVLYEACYENFTKDYAWMNSMVMWSMFKCEIWCIKVYACFIIQC